MVGPSLNTPTLIRPTTTTTTTIKFLCSYGGKIIPRYPDGKLRYHGGETRVLAVDRSISFAELLLKLGELCGSSVCLRCQLPEEDLDALVSVTSDEDLANLIEEYDRAAATPPVASVASSLKIRAFLSLPKKTSPSILPASTSPPNSSSSSSSCSSSSSNPSLGATVGTSSSTAPRCHYHQVPKPAAAAFSPAVRKMMANGNYQHHHHHHYGHYNHAYGNPTTSHVYLVHNGNHWQ